MRRDKPTTLAEKRGLRAPSFKGLVSASPAASAAAVKNKKTGTRPEEVLASALRNVTRHRFVRNHAEIAGRPDIVFLPARVAIFVDGDFWHGRDWRKRREKLKTGNNASYWLAKIARNRANDRKANRKLKLLGWQVLRFWESDVLADAHDVSTVILRAVRSRRV